MISAVTFEVIDWNSRLLDLVVRLLVSVLCGFAIGYERKTRSKEAGIRTHAIVCLAAALIMEISLYGVGKYTDTGRIAAQIVSGIGFLGAGIIFYRREVLHGLTTAAGVWATAGIGMAIGAGMYSIGIISTVLLVLLQVILHRPFKIMKGRVLTTLRITVSMESADTVDRIQYLFDAKKFLKFKTVNCGENIGAEIELVTEKSFTAKELYDISKNNSFIKSLEKTDEI